MINGYNNQIYWLIFYEGGIEYPVCMHILSQEHIMLYGYISQI